MFFQTLNLLTNVSLWILNTVKCLLMILCPQVVYEKNLLIYYIVNLE